MTNAELITELTYHASIEKRKLLSDAADALEAADKRIAELSLDCEMYQQKCMELYAQMRGERDE